MILIIYFLFSGNYSNLALDEKGNVWSWGKNEFGQLCIGTTTPYETKPKKIAIGGVLNDKKIVGIFTGPHNSFVLDESGSLFSCGKNQYGLTYLLLLKKQFY